MKTNLLIDQIIDKHKDVLGRNLIKYRNHAYRVYHLCTNLDRDFQNNEKYAIASAFHDLGIWTNNTFDYIAPSIQLAKEWLSLQSKAEWMPEIATMIDMHHKISHYNGKFALSVEVFRKADWIDISYGLLKFGIDNQSFKRLIKEYPTKGFHRFLIRKSLHNFLLHPLNPLPMFKK